MSIEWIVEIIWGMASRGVKALDGTEGSTRCRQDVILHENRELRTVLKLPRLPGRHR